MASWDWLGLFKDIDLVVGDTCCFFSLSAHPTQFLTLTYVSERHNICFAPGGRIQPDSAGARWTGPSACEWPQPQANDLDVMLPIS